MEPWYGSVMTNYMELHRASAHFLARNCKMSQNYEYMLMCALPMAVSSSICCAGEVRCAGAVSAVVCCAGAVCCDSSTPVSTHEVGWQQCVSHPHAAVGGQWHAACRRIVGNGQL